MTAALCRNETGRKILITADRFVLAAGAIDNARLLLNSKSIVPEGLGNERDQVGRYLINHPKDTMTVIRVRERRTGWSAMPGGHMTVGLDYVGVRLREPQQLKEGALNSYTQPLAALPMDRPPRNQGLAEICGSRASVVWHETIVGRRGADCDGGRFGPRGLAGICQHTGIAEPGGVAAHASPQPTGPHDWTV